MKIKQILTTGILGATLVVGFSGCSMNKPLPSKQINTTKTDSINLKYKFVDNIKKNEISKNNIIYNLTQSMTNNSNYPKIKRQGIRQYGQTVSYKNNNIIIQYINGYKFKDEVTKVTYNIPFKIKKESTNIFTVKATFPQKYTIRPFTDIVGKEFKPLAKINNLEYDAKKMFDNIKLLKINRNITFQGEVNTKYPDKAVYANFKRILGNYRWNDYRRSISDVKKQNTFSLVFNNQKFPLYIEIYPYRDGSKVVYSSNLKYTIDSNGNATLTKEDIKKLHKKIIDIVNN